MLTNCFITFFYYSSDRSEASTVKRSNNSTCFHPTQHPIKKLRTDPRKETYRDIYLSYVKKQVDATLSQSAPVVLRGASRELLSWESQAPQQFLANKATPVEKIEWKNYTKQKEDMKSESTAFKPATETEDDLTETDDEVGSVHYNFKTHGVSNSNEQIKHRRIIKKRKSLQ